MQYYLWRDQILATQDPDPDLIRVGEEQVKNHPGLINILARRDPACFRRSFCVSDPTLATLAAEGLHLLQANSLAPEDHLPAWLVEAIEQRRVRFINTAFPRWRALLEHKFPAKWRVNVLGLGDVGGMLVTGLRLLGGDCLDRIGIHARKPEVVSRWEYELNQIVPVDGGREYPEVVGVAREELFACDMFVFCASAGVPPVGAQVKDVRMVQLAGNGEILKSYVEMARETGFRGIFAVVSDPVDLLCKTAYLAGSCNPDTGETDYLGLAPEQIRGYGLGVMYARACYFADREPGAEHFRREGRVFGPHGQGLVVADSIDRYHEELSRTLTAKTLQANLQVRETGFKPFIAPALSSGTLSLLATIRGEWHYSATFMGGVYMGARNRLLPAGVEIERLPLPQPLLARLEATYTGLRELL